jgi:hypothetical protein
VCASSLLLLRDLMTGRSLVFFVGAGVSRAEPTRCLISVELLEVVFGRILLRVRENPGGASGSAVANRLAELREEGANLLGAVAEHVGLEITLGDLRQIWEPAFSKVLLRWAELTGALPFNLSHFVLAAWMRGGGTVITTNYDCFIEKAYHKLEGCYPETRYSTSHQLGPNDRSIAFDTWRADLARGGVLFKIHGSFDDLGTCLAAMDQVGTVVTGHRADLLRHVFSERPVCVVGWRGIDPDIPPVLASARATAAATPVIWILYQGADPDKPFRLDDRLSQVPRVLSGVASESPLVSEANQLFGDLHAHIGAPSSSSLRGAGVPSVAPQQALQDVALDMPPTAAARFLGIVCRRGGDLELARRFESAATELAEDRIQWAAGVQEQAHVLWQRGEYERAGGDVARVTRELRGTPDVAARLTADFGDLSMTVVNLRTHPSGALRLFSLFRRYRRDIDALAKKSGETQEVHLHRALYHLYSARLRLRLAWSFGRPVIGVLRSHILSEFDTAKHHIGLAEAIHVHSTVDVLSYRALALARFGRCDDAWVDFVEAERLADALGDAARREHLRRQRERLEDLCGTGLI